VKRENRPGAPQSRRVTAAERGREAAAGAFDQPSTENPKRPGWWGL